MRVQSKRSKTEQCYCRLHNHIYLEVNKEFNTMVKRVKHQWIYTFIILPVLLNVSITLAQTTAFTYQGKLTDNGTPANGNYDLTFKLFDTPTIGSGAQQGTTL